MLHRGCGIGVGLAAAFAAGLWIGSVHPSRADTPLVGGKEVRYMLSSASDGVMYKIDTWSGETWTLVMGDVRPMKDWAVIGPKR